MSFEATALVPIHDAGAVVGVVGLMWATRQSFSEDRATEITATVQRVAHLLLRGTSDEVPDGGVLHALPSVNQDPWLLLGAVAGPDEVTRDFVVQAASPWWREPGHGSAAESWTSGRP